MSWKICLQPKHDLYLFVQTAKTRSWVQRLVIRNRYRELEPSAAALVPLADTCRFERVPTSAKVAQCVL